MSLLGVVAGDARWSTFKLSVFLYEGNITPGTMEDQYGNERPAVQRAAPMAEGDLVELFDDEALVYSATQGLPVVRALSGTGAKYIGRIISIEKAQRQVPAAQVTALADMLSGDYLRLATVEMIGMSGMMLIEATISLNGDGADVIPVGDPTKLVWDVSEKKFWFGNGTGTQIVPLTRLTGATNANVTGPILVGIGLQKLELAA